MRKQAVSWWADPRRFELEPPSSPGGMSMKPSPDDHQIEPPKTRAHFPTDVDESVLPKGSLADRTEDDITKKMPKSSGSSSSFGMGSSLGSQPVSTGGTPLRGVSGKIE